MPQESPVDDTPVVMNGGVAVFEVFRQPLADPFPLFLCRTFSASRRTGTEQIVARADGAIPLVDENGYTLEIDDDNYLAVDTDAEEAVEGYPVQEIRALVEQHGIILKVCTGVQAAGGDRDDLLPANGSLITPSVEGEERVFRFIGKVLPGSWTQQVIVFTGGSYELVAAVTNQILSYDVFQTHV